MPASVAAEVDSGGPFGTRRDLFDPDLHAGGLELFEEPPQRGRACVVEATDTAQVDHDDLEVGGGSPARAGSTVRPAAPSRTTSLPEDAT